MSLKDAQILVVEFPKYAEGNFTAQVTVKNTGRTIWTQDYRLGLVGDDIRFGAGRFKSIEGWVRPGESYTFTQDFIKPTVPGGYTIQLRMVHERVEWFGMTQSVFIVVPGNGPVYFDLPEKREAGDTYGRFIIDTGPYSTDSKVRTAIWKAKESIKIVKTYIWTGASLGLKADSHCEVIRSDGTLIDVLQWDHYQDPVSPVGSYKDCLFQVEKDEELIMRYITIPMDQTTALAHHVFGIWAQS